MENFDRENIDELLEIRQIRQYFPPSKFCTIQYWIAPLCIVFLQIIQAASYIFKGFWMERSKRTS